MKKIAIWLNSAFSSFDGGIFNAMHSAAEHAGGFLTPFCKVITLLGEKGIIFFFAAAVLMLFKKTRVFGVCMFGAVACGALITNFILKDNVMRERPFVSEYREFWKYVGAPEEDGYSFPSGHATAVTAAAMATFLHCDKKISWTGFLFALVMCFSRVYLIAHYATDVIAGIIVGAISGVIAYYIAKLIIFILNKYPNNKFCAFCVNFDIATDFKKEERKSNDEETESQPKED